MAVAAPDPIDVHVGGRLRLARKATGLSQGKVAESLGISFQQVQKYEKGVSRLGAGRLYRVACLFDVSVAFFFRDMPTEIVGTLSQGNSVTQGEDLERLNLGDDSRNREVLRLVSTFLQISDQKLRAEVIAFVRSLQRSLAAKRSAPS